MKQNRSDTTKHLKYHLIPFTRSINLNFHLMPFQKITDKGLNQNP